MGYVVEVISDDQGRGYVSQDSDIRPYASDIKSVLLTSRLEEAYDFPTFKKAKDFLRIEPLAECFTRIVQPNEGWYLKMYDPEDMQFSSSGDPWVSSQYLANVYSSDWDGVDYAEEATLLPSKEKASEVIDLFLKDLGFGVRLAWALEYRPVKTGRILQSLRFDRDPPV